MALPNEPQNARFVGQTNKMPRYLGLIVAVVLLAFVLWWFVAPLIFPWF